MAHSIFALSSIGLTVLLFGFRSALVHMARDTARCYALLQEESAIATAEDQTALPKKIKYGKSLPHFQAIGVVDGQSITPQSLIGKSTIVVFFNRQEYERWTLEHLLAFFRSWWYHIDGNIYVILLGAKHLDFEKFPHNAIMDSDVGQYLVLGTAIESEVVRIMGLTQIPSVIELNAEGTVRRMGFFRVEEQD